LDWYSSVRENFPQWVTQRQQLFLLRHLLDLSDEPPDTSGEVLRVAGVIEPDTSGESMPVPLAAHPQVILKSSYRLT